MESPHSNVLLQDLKKSFLLDCSVCRIFSNISYQIDEALIRIFSFFPFQDDTGNDNDRPVLWLSGTI